MILRFPNYNGGPLHWGRIKPNSKDRYTPYRFDSIGKVVEKLVEDGRKV